MDGIIDTQELKSRIDKKIMEVDQVKLLYNGSTWYTINSLCKNEIDMCLDNGFIDEYIFMFDIYWWRVNEKYDTGDIIKNKPRKYPQLFESFWNSYHKERRIGKSLSYAEWIKLSQSDRDILPLSARKYTADIEANSLPKYMKHPDRFIKTRMFEDYANMESNSEDIIKVRQFYENSFLSVHQHPYAFSLNESERLSIDISKYGMHKTCELIWIFMHDYDPQTKIAVNEINRGYTYNVFSSLLKGVLGASKKKIPQKCKYCGKRIKHSDNCPVRLKEREVLEKRKREIDEAKKMNFDISGNMPWAKGGK